MGEREVILPTPWFEAYLLWVRNYPSPNQRPYHIQVPLLGYVVHRNRGELDILQRCSVYRD